MVVLMPEDWVTVRTVRGEVTIRADALRSQMDAYCAAGQPFEVWHACVQIAESVRRLNGLGWISDASIPPAPEQRVRYGCGNPECCGYDDDGGEVTYEQDEWGRVTGRRHGMGG